MLKAILIDVCFFFNYNFYIIKIKEDEMDFGKLISLVQGIILKPKETFLARKEEKDPWLNILVYYVLILVTISALGSFLSWMWWSVSWSIRLFFMQLILGILNFIVLMYLMQVLSKSFGGNGNLEQSAKTIAYSLTPGWVGSFFVFIPVLGWLIALAGWIYSLFVLYHALLIFMDVPKDKSIGYEIIFIIVAIGVMVILGLILNPIFGLSMLSGRHMMNIKF